MSSLRFKFTNLQKALKTVKFQHPRATEPLVYVSQDDLSALIQMILKADPKEYSEIAANLNQQDATLLIHAYERRLPEDKFETITKVLSLHPYSRQLPQAWCIFRNHPNLTALEIGMKKISKAMPATLLSNNKILQRLHSIWASENVFFELVKDLQDYGKNIDDWCRDSWPADLIISPGTPLIHMIQSSALIYGNRELLLRHSLSELSNWFTAIPQPMMDDALVNYIQTLGETEWDKKILERAVERNGLPASGGRFWNRIADGRRQAIQRLIAGILIGEFFHDVDDPSGRFRFWKNYVDHLVSINYPQNRERVLLHFRQLLVVEFRDLGNAGYIYEEAHKSRIQRVVTSHGPHGDCKIPDLAIHRIIHRGNWQRNTRLALSRVLN